MSVMSAFLCIEIEKVFGVAPWWEKVKSLETVLALWFQITRRDIEAVWFHAHGTHNSGLPFCFAAKGLCDVVDYVFLDNTIVGWRIFDFFPSMPATMPLLFPSICFPKLPSILLGNICIKSPFNVARSDTLALAAANLQFCGTWFFYWSFLLLSCCPELPSEWHGD